jgi:hypothetical protein
MLKTYSGSCACGAVRFQTRFDLSKGTGKCNCTFCHKMRLWSVEVATDSFTLLSTPETLRDYQGKNPVAHHFFCPTCGIHPFDRIDMPNMSGAAYYNIALACLDDLDPADLATAPIRFFDGLHDAWDRMPVETRHL